MELATVSEPSPALRIALVRQRYNPFGGAERFVERALAALAAEGAEITLITRSWEGAEQSGFRQVLCDPPYAHFWGGRAARDRSFARAAAAEMANGGYDITQSHERIPGCMVFRAGDGVHAAWLAQRGRVLSRAARLAEKLSPYHRYVLAAERAMYAHANLRAVICNSHMVADELRRYYGVGDDKLHVIYNGVDSDDFHPRLAERREAVRLGLGFGRHSPLLLFVGGGFARKGIPQLLRAFAGMARNDAELLVIGNDRKLAAMQRLAEQLGIGGRVRFVGAVKDVRPFFGAADAFVLPTLYDPFPNAAIEALACGLPLLTTTACGAAELVRPGENGWVVDALDVVAMSARLDDLCALAGDASARQAARQAAEALTLPAMSARLLDLYHYLADTRPA